MNTRTISITSHAKSRLRERLPSVHPKNYVRIVHAARYTGLTLSELNLHSPAIANYVRKSFCSDKTCQLRYYSNCIFVFRGNRGHARTLVTVVDLPNNIGVDVLHMNDTQISS